MSFAQQQPTPAGVTPEPAAVTPEREPAAERDGVRHELGERIIGLRTMDVPLRAVALVAIGLLAAAFAVGLLGHAGLPGATLAVAGEGPIRLPSR